MAERKGLEKLVAVYEDAYRKVPRPRDLVSGASFPYAPPTVPLTVEPKREEPTLGAHYDTGWARRMPARYGRFLLTEGVMRPIIAGLAQPERRGLDRLADLAAQALGQFVRLEGGLLSLAGGRRRFWLCGKRCVHRWAVRPPSTLITWPVT